MQVKLKVHQNCTNQIAFSDSVGDQNLSITKLIGELFQRKRPNQIQCLFFSVNANTKYIILCIRSKNHSFLLLVQFSLSGYCTSNLIQGFFGRFAKQI